MNNDTKLTLDSFRKKAIEKHKNRKKVAYIEVEGFGQVQFERPSNDQILKYMTGIGNSIKTNADGEVLKQDLNAMADYSKEIVYLNCKFLQDKELREVYEIKDPLETPLEVFGIQETINIASEMGDAFEGEKIQNDVDESIKN